MAPVEYVWVAGISRSDKATLITRLCDGRIDPTSLGLSGSVAAFQPMLDDLTKDLTINAVKHAAGRSGADHYLIKWQLRHANGGLVRRLMRAQPGCSHRILVIRRAKNELLKAWKAARRPYDKGNGQCQFERDQVDKHLFHASLPADLVIRRVWNERDEFKLVDSWAA